MKYLDRIADRMLQLRLEDMFSLLLLYVKDIKLASLLKPQSAPTARISRK